MSKDLKDTLNLPKTRFPMRANLVTREPERIAHWEKLGLYRQIQEKNASGKTFILHDGPPFTNGDVHIGTALNKLLKDIILRYKGMRGYRTPYVPGWDCHGLPIEHKVVRDLRAKGKNLSSGDLRKECASFSAAYIEKQRGQFRRLGVLADWAKEYRTMDPAYEAVILRTFAAFVEQGLVYRSKKPVYWSIPCETALAEAEIEYKDHVSPSIWVKFAVDGSPFAGPTSVVIWTTTPWTLPANLAIAVHPNLTYVAVAHNGHNYVVAEALAEAFIKDCKLEGATLGKRVQGRELEGLKPKHPFIDRPSPIVLAEYVTTDAGTGCVHTAPGHGLEDYQSGLKYGLEIYCPLDDQGKYVDDGKIPQRLVGTTVLETDGKCPANDAVLAILKENGALLNLGRISHQYPHCWRSKTPVVFRAMDQWFVSLDKTGTRQKALEAVGSVAWVPRWGENRIRGAIESRPDWCISRQRAWGVPIPVFYGEDGKQAYLDAGVIRKIADKVEKEGTNLWFDKSAEDILAGIPRPADWPQRLNKGVDTLDVWIDSGCSHRAVLKRTPGLSWPADLYLEGSDQHRGWFQSSLWTSVIADGAAPYRSVITHGFIVDESKKKISKSDGKPQTADSYINTYGSDVIRLWISSEDFRNDITISEDILGQVVNTYRTIRNTLMYQLGNLADFDPARDAVAPDDMDALDQWALHQIAELVDAATAAYDAYEFHRVYQLVDRFCSVTLSRIYHDILKDRLYTFAADSVKRRSSQTVMHHALQTLLRVLAPILPFTSDEAFAHANFDADYADAAIALESWPTVPDSWRQPKLAEDMERILSLRGQVNEKLEELRKTKVIGKGLDAQVLISGPADDPLFKALEKHRNSLAEYYIVSHVSIASAAGWSVQAQRAEGCRCPRCWRWVSQLVQPKDFADNVCERCLEALPAPSR